MRVGLVVDDLACRSETMRLDPRRNTITTPPETVSDAWIQLKSFSDTRRWIS